MEIGIEFFVVRVQRIRLNGEVAYDAGRTTAASLLPTAAAFAAPHGERAMLLSGELTASERLGVVGPIAVQWSLEGGAAAHVSVSVRLIEYGSALEEVELAHATLLPMTKVGANDKERAYVMRQNVALKIVLFVVAIITGLGVTLCCTTYEIRVQRRDSLQDARDHREDAPDDAPVPSEEPLVFAGSPPADLPCVQPITFIALTVNVFLKRLIMIFKSSSSTK